MSSYFSRPLDHQKPLVKNDGGATENAQENPSQIHNIAGNQDTSKSLPTLTEVSLILVVIVLNIDISKTIYQC